MADWITPLLGAVTGVAVVLSQVRRLRREATIRRVVDWSLKGSSPDRRWADRLLSLLLSDRDGPDRPAEPSHKDLMAAGNVPADEPEDPPVNA
jgi:hypothetical protein